VNGPATVLCCQLEITLMKLRSACNTFKASHCCASLRQPDRVPNTAPQSAPVRYQGSPLSNTDFPACIAILVVSDFRLYAVRFYDL
jgi:hypothetical protein